MWVKKSCWILALFCTFKNNTDSKLNSYSIQAHVLLYILKSSKHIQVSNEYTSGDRSTLLPTSADLQAHVTESYNMVSALYEPFKSKAKDQVRVKFSYFSLVYSDNCLYCILHIKVGVNTGLVPKTEPITDVSVLVNFGYQRFSFWSQMNWFLCIWIAAGWPGILGLGQFKPVST